jgi:hypothetical protein
VKIIDAQEALAVMSRYWDEKQVSQEQRARDIKDLACYMTISIGENRRLQKAGASNYALMDPAYEPVPRAWIEEWMVR